MGGARGRRGTAAWLGRVIEDATRAWQPGDECAPYRGGGRTRVARVAGQIVYLENGESLHISKMRRPS